MLTLSFNYNKSTEKIGIDFQEGINILISNITLKLNDRYDKNYCFNDRTCRNFHSTRIKGFVKKCLDVHRNNIYEGVPEIFYTDNIILLKEFDIQSTEKDIIIYHSVYCDKNNNVTVSSSNELFKLENNYLSDIFDDMINRQTKKEIEELSMQH